MRKKITYVGWIGFLWNADEGGGWGGGGGISSVEDELAEVVPESELDPDVESESVELSPEELSEVESEDDEDDGFVDLFLPGCPTT